MKELFITFEQALALKELGFNKPCLRYFWNQTDKLMGGNNSEKTNTQLVELSYNILKGLQNTLFCSAPTWGQVFEWFQTNNGMYHNIKVDSSMSDGSLSFIPIVNNVELLDVGTYQQAELECIKKND